MPPSPVHHSYQYARPVMPSDPRLGGGVQGPTPCDGPYSPFPHMESAAHLVVKGPPVHPLFSPAAFCAPRVVLRSSGSRVPGVGTPPYQSQVGNPGTGGNPPEPWGPLDEQEEWKTEVEDHLRETRRKLEFQASYYQERQEAENMQARTAWERLQLQVGNASMESVNINNPPQ